VPEWRRKGVSRALLCAIESLLCERGASGYQVTVAPFGQQHQDLRAYYMRLGFTGEGRLVLRKSL